MTDSFGSPLQLSLLVALTATIAVAIIGTVFGYILSRAKFLGKTILEALCTLPLVLPPTVIGFYLLETFGKRGWLGRHIYEITGWTPLFTWQAAAIASFIVALPIMVKTSRAAIDGVDKTYEEVAYGLGASRMRTAFQITLPLAAKGLVAGVALSFARALGEFGATLMVAGNIPGKTQTMPLAIYEAMQTGDEKLAAILVLVLTISSLCVLIGIDKLGARW